MTFKETGQVQLYVRSMGKVLRVTAVFSTVDECNEHCRKHPEQGVVAEMPEGPILLANIYDKGLPINLKRLPEAPTGSVNIFDL